MYVGDEIRVSRVQETTGIRRKKEVTTELAATNKHWNKCNVCGRFISYEDLTTGAALRELETPDTHFSRETYITLCPEHNTETVWLTINPKPKRGV